MDNKNKPPQQQEKEQDNKSNQKGGTPLLPPIKRSPASAIVWLLILIAFGVLLVMKTGFGESPTRKISQSEFETYLQQGQIISAKTNAESDRIMNIEGKMRLTAIAVTPPSQSQTEDKPETAQEAKTVKSENIVNYRTRVVYSEKIDEMLRSYNVSREVETRENWWNALVTLIPILLIIGLIYFLFSRQMKMAGKGAMQFGKSRARVIMPSDLNISFDDIAGADEAKEEVKEIIDFLKDPLKFKLIGGKIPKGCLLTGQPGTGKTLLAKAVASAANTPFFSISGSDFVEMFVGVGASRVRDMFEQARKHSPSLIFIDEIDAVGRSRFSGLGGGHDEREQTLNAMLVEMDGLETQSGIIVIAATNRPDVLDPALLRPGRFDRQINLDLPDIKGRRQILDVHIKNIRVGPDVKLDLIAKTTPGFSGADLANLCNEAALLAARNNREFAIQADMEEARDKVRWGRERRSRKINDRERKLTAYHEAGHTLLAMYCENATPVHKVTIIPRGCAYLGATMTMPNEDSYTQSRNELMDELAVLMGGRVAEELVFKDITSGAAGDIEHASRIARLMVCAFGMNDVIGPVRYGDLTHPVHVRADQGSGDNYSQVTAAKIDEEVKNIVHSALERARDILRTHYDELEKIACELLEKESLTGNEVRKLIGMPIIEEETSKSDTEMEKDTSSPAPAESAEPEIEDNPEVADTPQ